MSNTRLLGSIARRAGLLAALGLAVCATGVGQVHGFTTDRRPTAAGTEPHVDHPAKRSGPEAELEEALALRKRLTERDLRSAIRLLADSARQFATSGRPHQAAAANLEAGDVYLMMSNYQPALAAYRQALAMSEGSVDQRCAALSRIARTYANIARPHE